MARFRIGLAGILVVVLAGCNGSPAPSRPTAAGLTPTATTSSNAGATAPSHAPAPTPVATITLVAIGDWRALSDPARFSISVVERIVAVPDGFVAVGWTAVAGTDCDLPAVWTSADAVAWTGPTLLPMARDQGETFGSARAVAVTSTGIAVGGHVRCDDRLHAAIWFSPDSRSFGIGIKRGTKPFRRNRCMTEASQACGTADQGQPPQRSRCARHVACGRW